MVRKMRKKIRNQIDRGFTLIEVLIASAIFVILITTVVATFGFSSDLQNKTLAIREASQSARFIIEAIARDIRLADSFEIIDNQKINIIKNNEEISYYFEDDDVFYSDGENIESLTSDTLQVLTDGNNQSGFDGIDARDKEIQSYVKIKIVFKTTNSFNLENKNSEKFTETIETTVATRAYEKGYEKNIIPE